MKDLKLIFGTFGTTGYQGLNQGKASMNKSLYTKIKKPIEEETVATVQRSSVVRSTAQIGWDDLLPKPKA